MNEDMIRLWNEIIPEDGHVFHLGDVSLMSPAKTESLLYRLNGKIYLLKGNHEKSVLRKESTRNRFEWIKERYEFYAPHKGKKYFVVMSHYAHRVWNKSHHGSIHLYGHSHAGLEDQPWGKSMDVGVDNALRLFGQCRPFKLDEVMSIMEKREIKNTGDHHK